MSSSYLQCLTPDPVLNQRLTSIGVFIATHRRPDCLLLCLDALTRQNRQPDQVIIVVRADDRETQETLRATPLPLNIKMVLVVAPGLIAARNAGIDACTTDILAMIDDDTRPQPEWLERVLQHFEEDASLGGLGGRDRCFDGERFEEGQEAVVGKIQWFGRMIGNHHLGFGAVREVDFIKGANMSYRSACFNQLRFDERLKGKGAQPREDTAFSVAVKSAGWKLAYDPEVIVDHYAATRDEERLYVDVKALTNEQSFRELSYNDILSIWLALSRFRRAAFVVWSVLVGTRICPGLVQAVRLTPTLGKNSWHRFYVSQQGKMAAFRTLLLE